MNRFKLMATTALIQLMFTTPVLADSVTATLAGQAAGALVANPSQAAASATNAASSAIEAVTQAATQSAIEAAAAQAGAMPSAPVPNTNAPSAPVAMAPASPTPPVVPSQPAVIGASQAAAQAASSWQRSPSAPSNWGNDSAANKGKSAETQVGNTSQPAGAGGAAANTNAPRRNWASGSPSQQPNSQANASAPEGTAHATSSATASGDTVYNTLLHSQNHRTLARLISQAGLAQTLEGPGPFTIFAPSDAAFGKMAAASLEDLQRPENRDKLAQIISYHVVQGQATQSADLAGRTITAATVEGQSLSISSTANGQVTINGGARVTQADMKAGNGMVHSIDTVLLPPPMVATTPAGASQPSSAAASAAGTVPSATQPSPKQ